ncbi:serine hydrolase domain-containing protein [Neptunitalea lumnitzerae]|uniref:Penicillin-binding protein PbpX n=1 Tax=Neptunitalea lumnitzerae TaxID=2965509 RepID=A0ABQ5MIE2_9FLAO|nr:serine hydrolase domain-containing protein [Neptunitalea sp. Y10]GLB48702.1 putative penicillin-binding protein PbpX [Neptunitalea sp. Y10]
MKFRNHLIIVLLLPLQLLAFQKTNITTPKSIDSLLSSYHKKNEFNGNILVVKNNTILLQKSYGYATANKKDLLTETYRFNIGSIYKEFPAAAIMQLREQHQLKVTDTISKYLKNLPEWSNQITIAQLLNYSTGLPQIPWGRFFQQGTEINETNLMSFIKNEATLQFKPGTDYLYTNCSPILLNRIVTSIAGEDFDSYVKNHLFTPYNLNGAVIPAKFPYSDSKNMAEPFNANFEADRFKMNYPYILFSLTTTDLYQWFRQLDNEKIINKQSLQLLSQPANTQLALGSTKWEGNTLVKHQHHGSAQNFESLATHYLEDDVYIILATNQKNGNLHVLTETIKTLLDSQQ